MIGFKQIVGGAPSSVSNMTKHLLTQTVSQEHSQMAQYYARGMVRDNQTLEIAHAIAEGRMSWQEGTDILVDQHMASVPKPSAEERANIMRWEKDHWVYTKDLDGDRELIRLEAERRISYRLDVLADRIEKGLMDAPLAVVRPDIDPRVLVGLGIERDGILSGDEINALIAGRRADGELIEGKKYSVERRLPDDPRTGERKWSSPIGSYDFCPTPDKSVSVAWAFAPSAEQAQIFNAHMEAAREAVAYIATEVGQARIGKGGEDGFEPGHVGWLEFTHHTTRRTMVSVDTAGEIQIDQDKGLAGDPDLHTHFLIPNAVFCDSGRVGSLDTMAIKGFIFEADAFYHARLGTKLREAGFEVGLDDRTGAARMTVIPEEINRLFSKRSNVGEALARKHTADRGEIWDDLSLEQKADRIKAGTQGFTQKVKGGKDDEADFQEWRQQARAAGWQPGSLQFVGPNLPELTIEQRHRAAYEIGLPWLAEKLEHRSVVPHWDLRLAALRGLVETGTEGLTDIKGITTIMRQEGVQQYGEKTAIIWGQEEGKRYTSVTTALHERDEKEFVLLAQGASRDKTGAIPRGLLQQKIEWSGLDFSDDHGRRQREVILMMGEGGRFGVAIGSAGAGKTSMLKPLVASWKEMQRDVWGASLAWRQTDDLVEAGIDRRNLRAFSVMMKGIDTGQIVLTSNSVVAVDEWGLLGTRQGLELLRARDKHGFSIVALGDDKQCGSIEAGAIIDLSRRALGASQVPEILTTKRQQSEREREIVGLFRRGEAGQALDMKRADGTAEMIYGGRDSVMARVASLYAERLDATGKAPTISAPTNSDAHQIGEAVRVERRRMGLVDGRDFSVRATDGERDYSLRLAVGDRVRLFSSTRAKFSSGPDRSIGRNGSVLEVRRVDEKGVVLEAADGRVGLVPWENVSKAHGRARMAYGYATTIHTSQGSTTEEHIFALPSGSGSVTGAAGYTASTRHRQVAYLITSEVAERIAVRESRPINDAHEVTQDDKWANVAKNFVNHSKMDSALALLEKVSSLHRGAVKSFHHSMRPSDPGQPEAPARNVPQMVQERGLRDIVVQRIARGIRNIREFHQRDRGYPEISR